jgi:uncharacterized membrane protein
MSDPELERKNIVLGLWLLALFVALLGLTAIVAVLVAYA